MYKIIRRSNNIKRKDYDTDFDDRNYNFPLAGCSNYTKKIKVNDIVGVIFRSTKRTQVEFECSSSIVSDEYIQNHPSLKRNGSFFRTEEHLFKITKIIGNKYSIEPFYLDTNKIISKGISEGYDVTHKIETRHIDKIELILNYLNNLKIKYFYYTGFKNVPDVNTDKYKYYIFDTSNGTLTKQLEEQNLLENFICDTEKVYALALEHYYPTYDVKFYYTYSEDVKLAEATILDVQTIIKFQDIYRVYTNDEIYYLSHTEHLTSWQGIILNEEIRTKLRDGNVCRVCIKKKNDDSNWLVWCAYFTIIKKISNYKYLAQIENFYGATYEDIVIVIDSRAITEVPVDWSQNQNLESYYLEEGNGFAMTGHGALKTNNVRYNITFEELF